MSGMLLVLTATIATSAFAISDLREEAAGNISPIAPIEPNRGSFQELPGRSGVAVTDLVLDPVTQEVKQGNVVTFTGKLTDANGEGVANAQINIIDHSADAKSSSNDSNFDSEIIATIVTNSEGFFEATWMPNESRTYTIYAQFNGNEDFLSSKSDRMTVSVQL